MCGAPLERALLGQSNVLLLIGLRHVNRLRMISPFQVLMYVCNYIWHSNDPL